MVHGAGCQGNHVLCLYMSRPVASLETIKLSDGRKQKKMQTMMLAFLQKGVIISSRVASIFGSINFFNVTIVTVSHE